MKICFTGSQGTGKSTLLEKIIKNPQFKHYYRGKNIQRLLNQNCHFPINKDTNVYSQSAISGHISGEVLLYSDYINDRCLIDTFAYSRLSPNIPYTEKQLIENMYQDILKQYDYIFYTPIEFEVQGDGGIRSTDTLYQQKIDLEIQQVIKDYNLKVHTLTGTVQNRLQQFYNIIQKSL